MSNKPLLEHPDRFVHRHIGPDEGEVADMLRVVGASSLDELIDQTIPSSIRVHRPLRLPAARSEYELLELAHSMALQNDPWRSFLGMGYSDCVTPPVIQRNVIENPGWYTQYTPYQAEVSQGRLEALLNFQTMISDLTQLEVANASLLDEATAAAEAMHMMESFRAAADRRTLLLSEGCHPQTIDVVKTRAAAHGIEVIVGDARTFDFERKVFGVIVQYPATDGGVDDWRPVVERAHASGAMVAMACDLLALALLSPPGELGADIAVGSAQRFGVPLGYGGPHAAFFACKNEFVRRLPGRIIGVSVDVHGKPALRMALQTREQHIRREKATSNVCTAQALLANVASFYAVYHGPKGIRAIAERVHWMATTLAHGLQALGIRVARPAFFDTLHIEGEPRQVDAWMATARNAKMNLRRMGARSIGVALDETTSPADIAALIAVFAGDRAESVPALADLADRAAVTIRSRKGAALERKTAYLTHPVFNQHHSETEMLRYLRLLESRDISLVHSMIPLGSCTMKLNATAEMMPITWSRFARIHPFAPVEQAKGYQTVLRQLEAMLSEITGFPAVSLQPNSGAQGELAGLLVIRKHHESRGEGHRDVCLIPASAHGTNPASATMAGMRVVVVECDEKGYVELGDLERKARDHASDLAVLMVTYPSTYGIFEEQIERICTVVHEHGGQVYLDGANLNAQVGLCRPADMGADVCHVNLHKTFCIPHGGGGPGMGPIGVAQHLARFLPRHPVIDPRGEATHETTGQGPQDERIGAISAAPWGSASILLISWAYIAMMGPDGLKRASEIAILNANYVADRLHQSFPVFYRGKRGRVAHECILDTRAIKRTAGIEVDDVAKRLMDYGFHAPTMSFPIAGTLMVEPTESEAKGELDRFCEAMIAIRGEIRAIEEGQWPRDDNPLKHAPHTAEAIASSDWRHPYSREQAVFPAPWTRARKFWPAVGRINNAQGDRNLICACPPLET